MGNEALSIVDVQNDFCPGGALPVPNGDEVVKPLNRMMEFRKQRGVPVFVSRDWHPADMREHFQKWPVHCVQNTPGAELHPMLKLPDGAITVWKGMGKDDDAYSAFDGCVEISKGKCAGNWGFVGWLRLHKIEKLWIGGLATDYCVKSTVLDALRLGLGVTVLLDACRGVNINPEDSMKAIEEMRLAGAKFSYTFLYPPYSEGSGK